MIILCRNGEPALPHPPTHSAAELDEIKSLVQQWSKELGFQQVGISDIDLEQAERLVAIDDAIRQTASQPGSP